MYPCVRLTHIVLLCNQSDGLRLSEQFSLVICYFKTIFFRLLAYNYCNATLRCFAATYYAALSLSLLHCITLYYSCLLPLLILRSFYLLIPPPWRSRYFYPLRKWRILIYKNKIFYYYYH